MNVGFRDARQRLARERRLKEMAQILVVLALGSLLEGPTVLSTPLFDELDSIVTEHQMAFFLLGLPCGITLARVRPRV